MDYYNENKKRNIALGILVIAFIIFFISYLFKANIETISDIRTLEGDWKVFMNGTFIGEQPREELSAYVLPKTERGDELEFRYTLKPLGLEAPGLIFDSANAVVEVYLDSQRIYSWGANLYKDGKLIGLKSHKFNLPADYVGRELKIRLKASEPRFMYRIDSVGIYSFESENIFWFNHPLPEIVLGVAFMVVGILTYIFSCVSLWKNNKFVSSIALGSTLFLMGLYFLCKANVISLIIPDYRIHTQIEFISFFLIPPLLMVYAYNVHNYGTSFGVKVIYGTYIFVYSLLTVIVILLNHFTIYHYPRVVKYYYVAAVISYLLIYYILKKSDPDRSSYWVKITKFALRIFFVGALALVIISNLKYVQEINSKVDIWQLYEYVLASVVFVMLILFFTGFYINIKDSFILEYENERLSYMAHYDMITMLKNRRCFNESLDLLNHPNSRKDFSIIIIDLNDLKSVNDTLGHPEGDKMLVSLAHILNKSCRKNANAFRIGGDEFAILIEGIKDLEPTLKILQMHIDNFNKQSRSFKISIAIGVATSKDHRNPYDAMSIADQKMYENKREIKRRRSIPKPSEREYEISSEIII
ncbi:MAG: GGDEF domain-containing protein [Bacillota bacterium]|nr:GGDEF domain-containing protein [Bacillota bacterium]